MSKIIWMNVVKNLQKCVVARYFDIHSKRIINRLSRKISERVSYLFNKDTVM